MKQVKKIARCLALAALGVAVNANANAALLSGCTAKLANQANTAESLAKKAQCVVKEGMGNPNFLTALVASSPCKSIFAKYKERIKAAKMSAKSRNQTEAMGGEGTAVDFTFLDNLSSEKLNELVACYGAKKLLKLKKDNERTIADQKAYKAKAVSTAYAKAFIKKLIDARDASTSTVSAAEAGSSEDGSGEGAATPETSGGGEE